MLATCVRDRLVTDQTEEFGALTERHLDGAYRLATVILGDAMEAEDAVHDAAIAAWRGWSTLRDVIYDVVGIQTMATVTLPRPIGVPRQVNDCPAA